MLDKSGPQGAIVRPPRVPRRTGEPVKGGPLSGPRPSQSKRQKERDRQANNQRKTERRAQRKIERSQRVVSETGEDPDIAGIVPGPQPPRAEDSD